MAYKRVGKWLQVLNPTDNVVLHVINTEHIVDIKPDLQRFNGTIVTTVNGEVFKIQTAYNIMLEVLM